MKIKLLSKNATVPTRGSDEAAGYDIYASVSGEVVWDECVSVNTDIAIAIPKGYVGLIQPRSGLAFKQGIDTMAGVIDSDYRGQVKVLLTCHEELECMYFEKGDRIAQLVILPILTPELEVVTDLDATERGNDGFGSTGK